MSVLAREEMDNEKFGFRKIGDDAPARRHDDAGVSWEADEDDGSPDRFASDAKARRSFSPLFVKTLLSESQLNDRGLSLFNHDASIWLIDADADTLQGDRPSQAWLGALLARVDALRAGAADEDVPFSEASARAALDFARDLRATRQPGAFLIGNGNIRLLWTEGEEQIGLQFQNGGKVQFVMFARRATRMVTHMGDDDATGIKRQIVASGLRHLLNG
ncbi:hypothetical protein [Sphingomonas bacterium]|uniref:hypothetical protein n=1 Tax=Sphingomonas bacterium TaxID=1895847 RepID=UPI001575B7A0|nr:hypothetical protein [Sphingomonas bacterium]